MRERWQKQERRVGVSRGEKGGSVDEEMEGSERTTTKARGL